MGFTWESRVPDPLHVLNRVDVKGVDILLLLLHMECPYNTRVLLYCTQVTVAITELVTQKN